MKPSLMLTPIDAPELLEVASSLPSIGKLVCRLDGYACLDIDDAYVHQLFPLLPKRKKFKKPNYFSGKNKIGAHISVMYPEENKKLAACEVGNEYGFMIQELFTSVLDDKRYYILTVKADSLLALRERHDLPRELTIKNHLVDFHITLAVSPF